ncbi:uncharacterized protein LOC133343760 isoform X3 [Lethenteron reissneri]|uniref:uncharacterized protein LOC133343760 isoform X3 n=1 Tax=Lethenteron reissneri TaxID=7753 RepID=UPI002AB7AA97|nr:uncharacterized protein LOC133343760 isoform X3 [Lethenteron reissneri]
MLSLRLPRLLSSHQVPKAFQEDGIISGYRCPKSSAFDCILSLFHLTNETLNIWTHFLPACYFMRRLLGFSQSLDFLGEAYTWPLLAYLLTCCLYLLASSLAHTFSTMSVRSLHVCFFFDYAALSLYSLGVPLLGRRLLSKRDLPVALRTHPARRAHRVPLLHAPPRASAPWALRLCRPQPPAVPRERGAGHPRAAGGGGGRHGSAACVAPDQRGLRGLLLHAVHGGSGPGRGPEPRPHRSLLARHVADGRHERPSPRGLQPQQAQGALGALDAATDSKL